MSVKTMMEHVMSHQWFGNVVTPIWWSYAWLNEGFATYFEYLMTATVRQTLFFFNDIKGMTTISFNNIQEKEVE